MNFPDRAVLGSHECLDCNFSEIESLDNGTPVTRYECFGLYLGFQCKLYLDERSESLRLDVVVQETNRCMVYFDTFAPVVSCPTVRVLLVSSDNLYLDTKQVDYTCAFIHASITEKLYAHMPRGLEEEENVSKLHCYLYAFRQSPRNFFEHLKEIH